CLPATSAPEALANAGYSLLLGRESRIHVSRTGLLFRALPRAFQRSGSIHDAAAPDRCCRFAAQSMRIRANPAVSGRPRGLFHFETAVVEAYLDHLSRYTHRSLSC